MSHSGMSPHSHLWLSALPDAHCDRKLLGSGQCRHHPLLYALMGLDKVTHRKEEFQFGLWLKGSVNQGAEGKVQGQGTALPLCSESAPECWSLVLSSLHTVWDLIPLEAAAHTQGRSSPLCYIFLGTLSLAQTEICFHGGSKSYEVDKISYHSNLNPATNG